MRGKGKSVYYRNVALRWILSWSLLCVFALVAAGLGGCDDSWKSAGGGDYEDFGLGKVVSMNFTSEEISCMRSSTYAKPSVRTAVFIDGKLYPASVSFSGATSVDDYRKNYEVVLDSPYRGRHVYRINSMPTDSSASRAMLSYTVFERMGFDMPHYEPMALWINDEYAGLYLWQEKIDETYFTARDKEPVSLYQAEDSVARMDDTSNLEAAFSVKVGSKEMVDLKYVIQLLMATEDEQNCARLSQVLDVDSVLRYMAVAAYLASHDGIVNNFYLARVKGDQRLSILPWDLDRTFMGTVDMADGEFFSRNLMMTRFWSEDGPYGELYRNYYMKTRRVADAAFLENLLDEWASFVREAYENDPFLSTGAMTFDEHIAEIKGHIEDTNASIAQ